MTPTTTFASPAVPTARPLSFTPPGDRALRLAHLDPRPLRRARAIPASPWRSPTFYLACLLVAPAALALRTAALLR